MRRPVVVGYDGTSTSHDAARWAAHRAEAEQRSLRVLYVPPWPCPRPTTGHTVLRSLDSIRCEAERVLDSLDTELRHEHPALPADLVVVVGDVTEVLLREALSAHTLVLGKGATATQLAAHVRCPVVVVPGPSATSPDIVVGADGLPHSDAAVDFAFRSAETGAGRLVAIRTPGTPSVIDRSANHPAVRVVTRTVDSPADALVAASKAAGLLVIGSRGGAAVHGLLSRSITRAVLDRSHCPVAVVHGPTQ